MATPSTRYKRGFLEDIADGATDRGLSLLEALKAARSGRFSETKTGNVLVAVAGNGHSLTFKTPSTDSEITQVGIAELCQELIEGYRDAKSALDLDEDSIENDPAILAEMLALMKSVPEEYSEFIDLRTHD